MCVGQLIWRETKLVEKHWSFYLINNSFYLLWRSPMSFCSEYFTIRILLLLSTQNITSCWPSVWSGSGSGLDINCRMTGEDPNGGPGRDSSTVRSVLIVVFSSRRWEMIPTVLLRRLIAPAPRWPSLVNIAFLFHLSVNSRVPQAPRWILPSKCCAVTGRARTISSARANRSHAIMHGRTEHRTDVTAASFQPIYPNKCGFLRRKRYTKHKIIIMKKIFVVYLRVSQTIRIRVEAINKIILIFNSNGSTVSLQALMLFQNKYGTGVAQHLSHIKSVDIDFSLVWSGFVW